MTKQWLAAGAAIMMMAAPAFAQNDTTPAPGTSYQSNTEQSNTEKSTDANGVQVDKHSSYQSGPNGTSESSSTSVNAPAEPPPPASQTTTSSRSDSTTTTTTTPP